MITENDRQNMEKQEEEKRVAYLESVIKESARYERLMVNQDFKDVLKDMEVASTEAVRQIDIHTRSKYLTDDPAERARLDNAIGNFVIRLQQIEEYIFRPERVIAFAQSCREELARIKEKKHAARR